MIHLNCFTLALLTIKPSSATVANLQQKVEQLTTTNALMKEDLAIARNSLLSLQAENAALRQNQNTSRQNQIADNANVMDRFDHEMAESLAEERRKRQDSERELELQVCLKAETEMAMKLLEKDIHEKQDTIVSLRRQLEDIKQINLEMYRKLQVKSSCNCFGFRDELFRSVKVLMLVD